MNGKSALLAVKAYSLQFTVLDSGSLRFLFIVTNNIGKSNGWEDQTTIKQSQVMMLLKNEITNIFHSLNARDLTTAFHCDRAGGFDRCRLARHSEELALASHGII